jgi:hypothetical protein
MDEIRGGGGRHELSISVAGMAVSVRVDGEAAFGHTFGTSVDDGPVGLLGKGGRQIQRISHSSSD